MIFFSYTFHLHKDSRSYLFAFTYRLFREDFSPIDGANANKLTSRIQMQTNALPESLCIKAPHRALYRLWFQNKSELYTFTYILNILWTTGWDLYQLFTMVIDAAWTQTCIHLHERHPLYHCATCSDQVTDEWQLLRESLSSTFWRFSPDNLQLPSSSFMMRMECSHDYTV